MSLLFPLMFALSSSRKFESLVEKYKDQLKENSTFAKEQQAILWSLAELSRQVDKSVTAEEVEYEIGSKINEILERVDIADAILRKDFNALHFEFAQTKAAVADLVDSAKRQILDDMQAFKHQLTESLQALVDTSGQAQESWVDSSLNKVKDTFTGLRSSTMKRSIVFFVCFQVLLLMGLVFYKKLDAQLKMFL